ncbi:hypothetical protein TRAPUB_12647 [Trametes pubescens]|uniref:Uncharacterized protein n=1 Tax=Trametes pubescens TaxID=154538 RepID=A0A1M2VTA4_TRAPU|nr:hypothetical protein TRAPUB_12647 [Trametes pubescens]
MNPHARDTRTWFVRNDAVRLLSFAAGPSDIDTPRVPASKRWERVRRDRGHAACGRAHALLQCAADACFRPTEDHLAWHTGKHGEHCARTPRAGALACARARALGGDSGISAAHAGPRTTMAPDMSGAKVRTGKFGRRSSLPRQIVEGTTTISKARQLLRVALRAGWPEQRRRSSGRQAERERASSEDNVAVGLLPLWAGGERQAFNRACALIPCGSEPVDSPKQAAP